MKKLKLLVISYLLSFLSIFSASASAAIPPACKVSYGGVNLSKYSAVVRSDGTVACAYYEPSIGGYRRYSVASVSKMVTALTVLSLVDEGKISLDQPFIKQLPAGTMYAPVDSRWNNVTVRQLLSHTSGAEVSSSWYFTSYGAASRGSTWQNIAKRATRTSLMYSPGSGYKYSNTNFVILGVLIEAVTKTPYEAATYKYVFQPLKLANSMSMTSTNSYVLKAYPNFNFLASRPKTAEDGMSYAYYQWKMNALGPAGAWSLTPIAAATVVQGFDKLLSSKTSSAAYAGTSSRMYKLGIERFGSGIYGHTGTISGVRASVPYNKNVGRSSAILYNGYSFTKGADLNYSSIALTNNYR